MNGYTYNRSKNKNKNNKKGMTTQREYEYGKYTNPQVWEIYFADLPEVKGSHILYGKRPVIICSNDMCNCTSTEINVYPMTTRIRDWIPTHVTLYPDIDNGLMKTSQIYLEQGRTIPKRNLLEYWGSVTDFQLMLKIGHGILIQNAMLSCMNISMCWN